MKAKALAVLIPSLFLATSAIAQGPSNDTSKVPTAEERAHNREVVSDSTITGKVKAALATDVSLKTMTGINVDTDHSGIVTLTGKVDSADMKKRAGEVAKKVGGVKSVKNNLTIVKS